MVERVCDKHQLISTLGTSFKKKLIVWNVSYEMYEKYTPPIRQALEWILINYLPIHIPVIQLEYRDTRLYSNSLYSHTERSGVNIGQHGKTRIGASLGLRMKFNYLKPFSWALKKNTANILIWPSFLICPSNSWPLGVWVPRLCSSQWMISHIEGFLRWIYSRVSPQKAFSVGNHSHSCKFVGIFFVLASITVKIPWHGTGG